MKNKRIVVLLLFVLVLPFGIVAQESEVIKSIEKVMYAAKRNKMVSADKFIYKPENTGFSISKAKKYLTEKEFLVRNQAYLIIKQAASSSQKEEEVKEAVMLISKGALDSNFGIARYCAKSLQYFPRTAFSEEAKKNIGKVLAVNPKTIRETALIIGYLGLSTQSVALKSIANNPKARKRDRWYAHIALARLGEKESVDYCLGVYHSLPLGGEVVENMIPDFLYTRNVEIYNEVIKILYIDKKKCTSANPNNEKSILCGYNVMEQMASYIKDFPLEPHASGAIKTDSYEKSLQELRQWFTEHDNFTILDNKY